MLTPKQEKFVQGIVDGMSQAEAYRNAYSTKRMNDKTIWEEASRLSSNPEVSARIEELRSRIVDDKIMSAKARAERLTEFAADIDPNVAMKAIDLLNKMTGEYTTKIEGEFKVKKLEDLL